MRIIQILPTMAYGDAVGNNTLAIGEMLRQNGYETAIYAENIDGRLPAKTVKHVDQYREQDGDVVIFHLSIWSRLNELIRGLKAKVIIIYHNVTPPEFFESYSRDAYELCKKGLEGVKSLADVPTMCVCDSEFNKQDLIRMGYTCPIEVVPILINFDDYKKKADEKVIARYSDDGYTNLLFTGRVAPNKKQENVIKAFYYYKSYFNPKSRLFIVGSYNESDLYYRRLRAYIDELELNDVIFPGHIPFAQILSYYRVADVFVCMSEHEGFCVPLAEAMYFGVPVVAYNTTAVGETLGGSGLLLEDNNPVVVAEAINKVIRDEEIKETIIKNESVRLKDFDNSMIKELLLNKLKQYID